MQLDVAAYGWLDEGWAPSYPDDMPIDWRLDYYANEYRAVVVPCEHWCEQGDGVVSQWLDEAHGAFEFYWELGDEAHAQRLLAIYRALPDVPPPGGWLLLPGSTIGDAMEQELSKLAPVAHCDGAGECNGGVAVRTIEEDVNLRQLREQLDRFKEEEAMMVLLVVMPSPGAAPLLEQLQTLCQLYGG